MSDSDETDYELMNPVKEQLNRKPTDDPPQLPVWAELDDSVYSTPPEVITRPFFTAEAISSRKRSKSFFLTKYNFDEIPTTRGFGHKNILKFVNTNRIQKDLKNRI